MLVRDGFSVPTTAFSSMTEAVAAISDLSLYAERNNLLAADALLAELLCILHVRKCAAADVVDGRA